MTAPHSDPGAKARADLKRQRQQSEKLLGPGDGEEAKDEDRIDVIGRRIGRAIGYLLALALLVHLLTTYVF